MKRLSILSLILIMLTLVACGKKQNQQQEETCLASQFIAVSTTTSCSHGDACYMTYDVFKGLVFSCADCENIIEKNTDDIATTVDIPTLLNHTLDVLHRFCKVKDDVLRFNYLAQRTNAAGSTLFINTLVTLEDGTETENGVCISIPFAEDGTAKTDSIQMILGDVSLGAEYHAVIDPQTLKFQAMSMITTTLTVDTWSPIKIFWKPILSSATTVKAFEPTAEKQCEHACCNGDHETCNHECGHHHEGEEHECNHQCEHHEGAEHQCNHEGCNHK